MAARPRQWPGSGGRTAPLFGGQPPLALVTSGTLDGLMPVRRFLDAARGGLYMPPNALMLHSRPYARARSSSGEALVAAPASEPPADPLAFPPIGLFETRHPPADLEAVMELAGWTNDRLVAERLRSAAAERMGVRRPNASIVMAAFLHAAPGGGRFNGPDLGAWYASARSAHGGSRGRSPPEARGGGARHA
jgi:hypothetical protein